MSRKVTAGRAEQMLNEPVNRIIPKLAVPTIISMLISSIYNMAGQKINTFNASQPFSVAQLPTGVYIVSWMTNGKIRSTKFQR